MSESSTESTSTETAESQEGTEANQESAAEGTDHWKSQARDWEKKAKADERARRVAENELKKLREQGMSDAEKAIEKARSEALAEGEKAAMSKVGRALVAAEARAALAGRRDDADDLIEDLDIAKFLTEDGQPDKARLKAWAERVAPKQTATPDLGLGRREAAKSTDMDSLIRRRAGVRG